MTRPQLETCTYFKFKRTMTGKFIKSIALAGICLFSQNVLSQEVTADSVMQHVKGKRLSIGSCKRIGSVRFKVMVEVLSCLFGF